MLDVKQIYPNLYKPDRRQDNVPVAVERRSGIDRRKSQRCPELNQDIYAACLQPTNPDATALSIVSPMDKVEDIQDSIKEKNYLKAACIALIFVNGFKKDLEELKEAKTEINDILKTGKIKRENFQILHSFTEGTWIEKKGYTKKIAKYDITLFDTVLGQLILKLMGMKGVKTLPTKKKNYFGYIIEANKVVGNFVAEIVGRSFMRIPIAGLGIMGLIEIPAIYKAKDRKQQFKKACISVSLPIFSSALLGAIGAYYPPLGFVGAGIGLFLGSKLAEKINNKISS